MTHTVVEYYKDQFTPWNPNHLVEDKFQMSADEVYTAYYFNLLKGQEEGAYKTLSLLFASLFVNGYIGIMFSDYGGRKNT